MGGWSYGGIVGEYAGFNALAKEKASRFREAFYNLAPCYFPRVKTQVL
jgi:hypothetical protein